MTESLNKPICPMKNAPCIKWMCAWWLHVQKQCAIHDLAVSLDMIMEKNFYPPKEDY